MSLAIASNLRNIGPDIDAVFTGGDGVRAFKANKSFTAAEVTDTPAGAFETKTEFTGAGHTFAPYGSLFETVYSGSSNISGGEGSTGEMVGAGYSTNVLGSGNLASVCTIDTAFYGGSTGDVTTVSNVRSTAIFVGAGCNVTNFHGFHVSDPTEAAGASNQIANLTGLYVAKLTKGGTSNRGIWLAGDDQGADIVFGAGADVSMHFNGTNLELQGSGIVTTAGTVSADGTIAVAVNGTVVHLLYSTTIAA